MDKITELLFENSDEKYIDFHSKLIPTVDRETIIGVRVPIARKLAKEIIRGGGYADFLEELPHKYYDENILHALILNDIKDFDECLRYVEKFLPFVDNWAVCDILSPKVFKKHEVEIFNRILMWTESDEIYTCRFGIEMLMSFYLDERFKEEYLEIPKGIRSEEYYVNMMIAWFFATALAKQWDAAIKVIEGKTLEVWVHNKSIQKAIESRRISDEKKEYLRSLKKKLD